MLSDMRIWFIDIEICAISELFIIIIIIIIIISIIIISSFLACVTESFRLAWPETEVFSDA